jgi:hypothetical protein
MKIPYTYTIEQLDITYGHMVVKYLPEDTALTALSYNVPIMFNEDGTQKPLVENIDMYAPYREWGAQKYLKDNANTLINSSGTIAQ